MKNMQRTSLIIFSVLVLFSSVNALEINAPERIPSYAPFTFTATLPSTETFTTSTVTFDGLLVATIYPSGACGVMPDWDPFVIKCDTFDADPTTNEGLTLIFTHTGFALGTHTISIQTQGMKSDNQTINLNVFDALDAKEKEAIDSSVTALTTQVQTLETKTTDTEQKWYESKAELETIVHENNQRVDEVQSTVGMLNDDYQKRVADAQKGFQIPFLSTDGGAGTGLATGSNAPLIGIGIVVVGIALFAFFTFSRKNKDAGFSSPKGGSGGFFEGNMDALFKSVPGGSSNKAEEMQPHKWAAEASGEKGLRKDVEDNPPEKINFGELIREERP